MTLAELQTKRDALLSSIANAHKQLQKGDKSITFQDVDQMNKALAILDREIAAAGGSTARTYRGRFIAVE